jgi:oxygen-independent coproporphyrinogen III oxidase
MARGCRSFAAAGFNRISIGVQSFNDRELVRLGRIHTGGDALAAIAAAKKAGFANFSFDLMYGLPGQSEESWRQSLEQALALAPEHMSLYELTVEEGTAFAAEALRKELAPARRRRGSGHDGRHRTCHFRQFPESV